MTVHPRISLHHVAFVRDGTPVFIDFCRKNSVPNTTLVILLMTGQNDLEIIKASAAVGGPKASTVNHPFATFPRKALSNRCAYPWYEGVKVKEDVTL